MYKIGELSRLCKIPVKTLRYYDNEGLLLPDRVDMFTGYRYYGEEKLAQCYRILAMKQLGFSLQEIKKQLLTSDENELLDAIHKKQEELLMQCKQTEKQLQRLQELEMVITEGGTGKTMFDIVIQKQERLQVAYSREIFRSRQEAELRLEEMQKQLHGAGTAGRALFIDYTMEYTEDGLDMAVCVETARDSAGVYPIKTIALEGDIAVLACRKEEIEQGYIELRRYLQNHLYQVMGPCYQFIYPDGLAELKMPVWALREKGELYNDDINVPFENDPLVVGHWLLLDIVPSRECFHEKALRPDKGMIKELYFLPEGQWYWCFGWTKGYLLSRMDYPTRLAKNRYTIEHLNGKAHLFVEMKGEAYHYHQGKPEIWVFEQADNMEHSMDEIRVKDDIDMPFLPDEQILGQWKACDFVEDINDFNCHQSHFAEDALFWKEVIFFCGGNCRRLFKDGSVDESPNATWTKNYVLGHGRETAERYVLKTLKGREYLFIQWKCGDYSYGGRTPCYYVFARP